jgi:hypothetical protein
MMDKDLLRQYIETGFSPEEIIKMSESLNIVNGLISRLIIGDFTSINLAVDEAIWFIDGYVSIMKDKLH